MKTDETKLYRVTRQFTLEGSVYGRIDKPRFTQKQVDQLTAIHGKDNLPIEEITKAATPGESATVAAAPVAQPTGEVAKETPPKPKPQAQAKG